jgi:hypothetical protein
MLRDVFGVRSADEFINYRPAENATMLRQRAALLSARLAACDRHENCARLGPIHAELTRIVGKAEPDLCWDDVQRGELLMARLAPKGDLAAAIDRELAIVARSAPAKHAALADRWAAIQSAQSFDEEAARGVLVAAQEETHWRGTQTYLIRKLGVIYAARLVSAFVVAILFGLSMVVWEVYFQSWPLGDARFSGFPMALVAGLLGASFSALTNQRTVTNLDNLEEVRTAIGYPMILLRLGVGVSAAAILYFFFEAGLVEGVLFPTLSAVGFDQVALAGTEEGAPRIAVEALRAHLEEARMAAAAAADKIALVAQAASAEPSLDAPAPGASAAADDMAALAAALEKVEGGLSGAATSELGRYVPNAALSKLVVWSFLAGFSEKLVPSILGRVEETSRQDA